MTRALLLLSHRKQLGRIERIAQQQSAVGDELVVAALTPEARLSDEDIARVSALGARCINFDEIEMDKSHAELSLITTQLIQSALERVLASESLARYSTYPDVSLISCQANSIYTYGYRHLIAAVERTRLLIEELKPIRVIIFGPTRQIFRYAERPAITQLYDNELTYSYVIESTAQSLGIEVQVVKSVPTLWSSFKLSLRGALLRAYKFYVLMKRVLRDRRKRSDVLHIEPAKKPRVCAIVRGASEYWTIRPVLEMMREIGEYEPIILQDDIIKDPSAREVLERANEAFVPIHIFSNPFTLTRHFLDGVRMSRRFDKHLKQISFNCESTAHSESFYQRILGTDGVYAREVIASMSKSFSEKRIFVHQFIKFLELYEPHLVITMSMVDNWGPLIRETAAQHGIKTLAIQNAAQAFLSMPIMIFADKYAVASQRQRDGLVSVGADPDRIVVTGIPRYDVYFNDQTDSHATRQALGIESDQKLILMTTQPTLHDENIEYIEKTLAILSRFPDAAVIIKLHPRERLADYKDIQRLIDSGSYKAQIVQQQDVLELIDAADLMLSRVSTTVQSALMIGTPIISYISKANQHAQRDYLETMAVTKISDLGKLPQILENWLSDSTREHEKFLSNRQVYLDKVVGVADGRATERLIKLISDMLKESGSVSEVIE